MPPQRVLLHPPLLAIHQSKSLPLPLQHQLLVQEEKLLLPPSRNLLKQLPRSPPKQSQQARQPNQQHNQLSPRLPQEETPRTQPLNNQSLRKQLLQPPHQQKWQLK